MTWKASLIILILAGMNLSKCSHPQAVTKTAAEVEATSTPQASNTQSTTQDSSGHGAQLGVKGVLDMFDRFQVVALGERHGSRHDAEFRLKLIADPEFPKKVDVIGVEFANPIHQDLLDAYVLDGQQIPREQLQNVWRDAFYTDIWTSPIYSDFIDAIRNMNLALPKEERVRIVGASRPIDWAKVRTPQELEPFMNRGRMMSQRIIDEILVKGQKGLLIFGIVHFLRGNANSKRWGGMTGNLSVDYGDKLGVVATVSGDEPKIVQFSRQLELTNPPIFFDFTTSDLGQWNAHEVFEYGLDGKFATMADGLLFLGEGPDELIKPPPSVKEDASYMAELKRRMALHRR